MKPYQSPRARLAVSADGSAQGRLARLLMCVLLCWVFVSFLSAEAFNFLVLFDVLPMSASMTPELVLDLLLSSGCLGLGGYYISGLYDRAGWAVVGLVALGFTLNTLRIIGLGHVLEMKCEHLWYDLAVTLKNPLVLYAGHFIQRRHTAAVLGSQPETP